MMKGPVPQKAIDIALPLALAQGFVMLCRRHHGSVADFVLAGFGWTAIVCVCRTKRLNELPEELAAQFRSAIAGLSRVPRSPGRSREIWACDYYGNFRFFRVTGSLLVEIGRDGRQLQPVAGDAWIGKKPAQLPAGGNPTDGTGGDVMPGWSPPTMKMPSDQPGWG
jgi:hypothetical protein